MCKAVKLNWDNKMVPAKVKTLCCENWDSAFLIRFDFVELTAPLGTCHTKQALWFWTWRCVKINIVVSMVESPASSGHTVSQVCAFAKVPQIIQTVAFLSTKNAINSLCSSLLTTINKKGQREHFPRNFPTRMLYFFCALSRPSRRERAKGFFKADTSSRQE